MAVPKFQLLFFQMTSSEQQKIFLTELGMVIYLKLECCDKIVLLSSRSQYGLYD